MTKKIQNSCSVALIWALTILQQQTWACLFCESMIPYPCHKSYNDIIWPCAILCSFCSYSTIAWIASVHRGAQPDVEYSGRSSTTAGNVLGFFTGLGDIAFGYAAHNVILEIQATLPSTPEKPSKKAMWKSMIVAYIVVALCYFPICIFGYWAFGNTVDDNILLSLEKPRWLIAAANIFVVVHVTGSYQVH